MTLTSAEEAIQQVSGLILKNISQEELQEWSKEQNYKMDTMELDSKGEDKLKVAYTEHIHEKDAEVRYILEGGVIYDIRNSSDQWISVHVTKGQLISVPKNAFHRFSLDDSKYVKAIRCFSESPNLARSDRV